jgi:hypothetical protein
MGNVRTRQHAPHLGTRRSQRYDRQMQLSEEVVREYIRIYKEDFGEELTVADARGLLSRLLALYQMICRPLPPGEK